MESERNTTLTKLIDDLSMRMGDLVKWPESQATREGVDTTMKALRKAFKADSYPRVFLYFIMLEIAHAMYFETANRDIKFADLKAAWIRLAELLNDIK
jgi:hypothetical protein